MPNYRLFFRLNTPLTDTEDLSFKGAPYQVTFRFREKQDNPFVSLSIDVEAPQYEQALTRATTFLPSILDALAYGSGAPMLLGICELILKDERGDQQRRGLHVRERRVPPQIKLRPEMIKTAEQIFAANGSKLPLCWLRQSRQRELILERFVFSWLGFEELAGETEVEIRCECGAVRKIQGADRNKAWAMFQRQYPDTQQAVFNKNIWGRVRNSVFHGSKYPAPEFLQELRELTPQLQKTIAAEIAAEYGLNATPDVAEQPSTFYYNTFFSWETAHPEESFAEDWPRATIERTVDQSELGRVGVLDEPNLRFHNAGEFQAW